MQKRDPFTVKSVEARLHTWLKEHARIARQAEAAPTRRDMATFLAYVRDNKVLGTQSAGNLPLKAVREVAALFVNPPPLDAKIGDRTYQLRSEEEVWPVYFLHVLADVGGLVETGRARRWRVTAQGERLLETNAPVQSVFLLGVWWRQVNWLIAFPMSGMGDRLPYLFREAALASLRALPTGSYVSFRDYAAELISITGLTWTAKEHRFADSALRNSIQRMVVHVLADFGALKCRYRKEPLGKKTVKKLSAIQLTPWGKALLDAVAVIGG